VGRTGAVIVIDAMLERAKHEKTLDVYGHVTCLRSQRNYMVQTEDQYVFIHDALVEAITSGNTEVPARNLYSHIQRLTRADPADSATGMDLEFKVCSSTFSHESGVVHGSDFFNPTQPTHRKVKTWDPHTSPVRHQLTDRAVVSNIVSRAAR